MSETVVISLHFRESDAGNLEREYISHVEVSSQAEHDEFDSEPRFLPFLEKYQERPPLETKVWLGNTLFQV
jgi:hypothetical protein